METKIKKILVPTDFSETSKIALEKAAAMAKKIKAELHLLHVVETASQEVIVMAEYPTMIVRDGEEEEASAEKALEELQTHFFVKNDILTYNHIRNGNVVHEIIKLANRKDIDMIIMGTHGASGYKEFILGSNSQEVADKSKIPVLTFQKETTVSSFANIVVPINNSLHSREKVNIVLEIAILYGSTVHIIGMTENEEKEEHNNILLKIRSVEQIIKSTGLPCQIKMINGKNLAHETLEYARKHKCDLIVINTGDESKIAHDFLRVFSTQIINHSKIPVLSVKPTEGHYENTSLIGYGNPMLY